MIETIAHVFSAAPSVGLRGIFQFVFSPGSNIWADISHEVVTGVGQHEKADVVITVSEMDFNNIVSGNANVEELFASGLIKIAGNMGLATLLPQVINRARNGNTAVQEKSLDMNRRYPAPARFCETLSAQQKRLTDVERKNRADVSLEEFQQHYLAEGIPVILSNALFDWPLFQMGREASLMHFAELQGITRHGDYVGKTFSTDRDFRSTPMQEFIASLDKPPPKEGLPAYMGNNIVPEQLIQLIRFPPYFDRSLYINPRIWIGPKGTLTPLHRDDTDNLFAQVWGQKSFILAAPHHRPALGTWSTTPQGGLDGCEFNPDEPDYAKFPRAQEVTFLRVVLQEGDMLFLPEGWFHQVRSLTTSLSVNFWVNSGRW